MPHNEISSTIERIPLSKIREVQDPVRPFQSDEKFEVLLESVSSNGILFPITVKKKQPFHGEYEIVHGIRRYHAAKELGLKSLKCQLVRPSKGQDIMIDFSQTLQLDWNRDEQLKALKQLAEKGFKTQKQRAERLGISQSYVSRLEAPPIKVDFPGGKKRDTPYEYEVDCAYCIKKNVVHVQGSKIWSSKE